MKGMTTNYQDSRGESLPSFSGLAEPEKILFMQTNLGYKATDPDLNLMVMRDQQARDIANEAYTSVRLEDFAEDKKRVLTSRLDARVKELETALRGN